MEIYLESLKIINTSLEIKLEMKPNHWNSIISTKGFLENSNKITGGLFGNFTSNIEGVTENSNKSSG